MAYNQAMMIRRDLLARMCKLIKDGDLKEQIDRIPLIMRPRHSNEVSRCCIHKDRAVIKYRLMAILGFDVRDEEDELIPLSQYAKMAEERKDFTDIMLTVVDEACSSCVKSNYVVTNMCHGCIGHPCTFACNKQAISVNEKAKIDPSKCVSCGLCMQACPFNAIIYQAVPCEESCPVGAISKDEYGVEHIDETKCIYCGRCREACPYGAIMEKTYLVQVYAALKDPNKKVVAMFAPALAGQFPAPLGKIISAIRAVGFDEVWEVAKGANITTRNEAAEFEERMEKGEPFMTTSCCHAYTELTKKHLTELAPYVSETRTPASYTAELVKKEQPGAVTVFIAPCVSKRHEGFYDPNIDYVLSFEELGAMMVTAGVDVLTCEESAYDGGIDNSGRAFPYTGGVLDSVKKFAKHPENIRPYIVDGIDKAVIKSLKNIKKTCGGPGQPNFIEFMMCKGGCVNGCNALANPRTATRQIQNFIAEDEKKKQENA
ncbi:MAG: monomeric [FeFe] hydrogenase [Bacteroidales bacterium]|nr:monomeric [FeFe] hydrogenase [Bacteroidales bacterium]